MCGTQIISQQSWFLGKKGKEKETSRWKKMANNWRRFKIHILSISKEEKKQGNQTDINLFNSGKFY